jgi:hypothetical protein
MTGTVPTAQQNCKSLATGMPKRHATQDPTLRELSSHLRQVRCTKAIKAQRLRLIEDTVWAARDDLESDECVSILEHNTQRICREQDSAQVF